MKRRAFFLIALTLLTGCALILDEATAPEVRQVIVSTSIDVTYTRATRAAARMGGKWLAYNPEQHTFTTQIKQAIALHVDVRRVAEGTQMTVTGTILPKELTFGMITEVDDFLIAYRNEGI